MFHKLSLPFFDQLKNKTPLNIPLPFSLANKNRNINDDCSFPVIDTCIQLDLDTLNSPQQLYHYLHSATDQKVYGFINHINNPVSNQESLSFLDPHSIGSELPLFISVGAHGVGISSGERNKRIFEVRKILQSHLDKIVAIGDIGILYDTSKFRFSSEFEKSAVLQMEIFEQMLSIAKEFSLPISFHLENSLEDFKAIILYAGIGVHSGVIREFNHNILNAKTLTELGFHVSLSGKLFSIQNQKKQQEILESLKYIPLDRFVLESCIPQYYPKFPEFQNDDFSVGNFSLISDTLQTLIHFLASVKKVDPSTVAEHCWKNTVSLFPKIASCKNLNLYPDIP